MQIFKYSNDVKGYYPVYIDSQADYWCNMEDAIKQLYQAPLDKPIMLHFGYHGISITSSDIYSLIEKYLKDTGRPKTDICIHSPNREEDDLNENRYNFEVCDEFVNVGGYWVNNPKQPDVNAARFGHFVGRPTTPRYKMFYDIDRCGLTEYFFQSRLAGPGMMYWDIDWAQYDQLDQWIDTSEDQQDFLSWYESFNLQSFDGLGMTDQYDFNKHARTNLVNQSDRYWIDIVFETLTVGKTFAPTEKLIRSLITKKPFIVYAAPNYLSNLKKIGFKTFDSLWDESYDQLQLRERYAAMLELIVKLSKINQTDFENLMAKATNIVEHNKNVLRNINVKFYKHENFMDNSIHEYYIS